MSTTTFIILGVSIASAIAILISAIPIIIVTRENGRKKLSKISWVLFICCLALILLPVVQDRIQQKELIEREKSQKQSYDESVSRMADRFAESSNRTVATLSEILGKYGYALDSSNKRLVKLIQDSSKTKVIIPENPVFQVGNDGKDKGVSLISHENNFYKYKVTFCSFDAASTGFNFVAKVVISDSLNNFTYVQNVFNKTIFSRTEAMQKNSSKSAYFKLPDNLGYNMVYIWIKGTYTNRDGNKTFPIDEIYFNNKNSNTDGIITGNTKDMVIKAVRLFDK